MIIKHAKIQQTTLPDSYAAALRPFVKCIIDGNTLSRVRCKYYIKKDDREHIIYIGILYCNLPISSPAELPLTTYRLRRHGPQLFVVVVDHTCGSRNNIITDRMKPRSHTVNFVMSLTRVCWTYEELAMKYNLRIYQPTAKASNGRAINRILYYLVYSMVK